MATGIRMRAKVADEITTVKALITHPMATGMQKDQAGELIPAHFIQEVVCTWNGKTLMTANWGGGVSKNPYLSFKCKGPQAGDSIELSWSDNKGESGSDSVEVQG